MTAATGAAAPSSLCVFTRSWRSSGAGLFAQSLVDGLLAEGAQVTFVCPPVENARFERPRPGLCRIRPPRERTGRASRPAKIVASLARMIGGAIGVLRARATCREVIVTIPDPLLFAVPMLALLRLTGARILFVAHDPLPHAWALPARWRRWEIAAHGACYRLASAVVVLSEPSRERLLAAFPTLRVPVSVIDHGVFLMGDPVPVPGSGMLLAFGTVRSNKGVLTAIEGTAMAARDGQSVRLVIAGGPHRDEADYVARCRAAAQAAGDAVDLRLGYVEDAVLERLIAECDALLMPYDDFHSQSGVAILAASNARPIIATRAGGIATLIDEGMPAVVLPRPAGAGDVAQGIAAFMATPAAVWRARHTSPLTRILAEPKSQSLRTWVSGWTSRFCGLMSRWHTPSEWMYARERQSWYVYSFMYSKGKVFLLFA